MTWLWPDCDLVVTWLWPGCGLFKKNVLLKATAREQLYAHMLLHIICEEWAKFDWWVPSNLLVMPLLPSPRWPAPPHRLKQKTFWHARPEASTRCTLLCLLFFQTRFEPRCSIFWKMRGLQPAARQFSCRGVGRLGAGCIVPGLGHNPKHNCYKQK